MLKNSGCGVSLAAFDPSFTSCVILIWGKLFNFSLPPSPLQKKNIYIYRKRKGDSSSIYLCGSFEDLVKIIHIKSLEECLNIENTQ